MAKEKPVLNATIKKNVLAFRDKNYNTNSPHYTELTKLVKEGDEDKVRDFFATNLVSGKLPGEEDKEEDVEL